MLQIHHPFPEYDHFESQEESDGTSIKRSNKQLPSSGLGRTKFCTGMLHSIAKRAILAIVFPNRLVGCHCANQSRACCNSWSCEYLSALGPAPLFPEGRTFCNDSVAVFKISGCSSSDRFAITFFVLCYVLRGCKQCIRCPAPPSRKWLNELSSTACMCSGSAQQLANAR